MSASSPPASHLRRFLPASPPGWVFALVALAAFAFFLQVYVRTWTPEHGLTRLLRVGRTFDERGIAAFRHVPKHVEVYPEHADGFDGQLYAELALDPLLRDPGLPAALDNPTYRAQRILLPWLAWLAGLGRPSWVLNAYAALNLAFWLGLAALSVRLFRPHGWTGLAGCAATLVTCGVIESMQASLTDLPAFTLTLAALLVGGSAGAGVLALAALARGTSLIGFVGLLEPAASPGAWLRRHGLLLTLAAAPLALWIGYVLWRFRGHPAGFDGGNLDLPFRGMAEKLGEFSVTARHGPIRWHRWFFELYKSYELHAVLTIIALLTQTAYVLLHREWRNPLWRWGAVVAVYFSCISFLSWESHFTITRHALPLTLAFNLLLAARPSRTWPLWFLLGNCFVPFGVRHFDQMPDRAPPPVPPEYVVHAAPAGPASAVSVRFADGWSDPQWTPDAVWRWARGHEAVLVVVNPGPQTLTAELRFLISTPLGRPLQLAAPGTGLLAATLAPGRHPLRAGPCPLPPGETRLTFTTSPELHPPGDMTSGLATFRLERLQLVLAP